ncbi:MAG: PqqD family peptide modification chaperone [bacterium]
MERPTFSPFWHRIREMRPRLRPHVQISRQFYRGKRWHVAHDPTSNQFYRLSSVAYDFVLALDGSRTVEAAWQQSLSKFGDQAPTQNEVLELLSQLYNSNLLAMEAAPETAQLLTRGKERTKKRLQQQAVGLMYFRLKLFNPDHILTFLEPLFRPVLNRWGLLAWALFVSYALIQVLSTDLSRFLDGIDSVIAPGNWGWLIVVFVLLKGWHELGHGLICKRFGGQVPEFGAMLLVLLPAPYVDASACWAFPSKWQRMAVGAGGMLFELFVAAIAALIWLQAADGSLTKQVCYYIMLTAGISTVLFNANPLMRFDGYFILSDLIEVPNLMQRSNKMLLHLFQKHIYRLKNVRPPASLPGEQAILITYGILGFFYRIFIFLVITLYVLGMWFIVGVLLAVWTFAMWFFLPLGKFIHWLATNSQLAEHRTRAIATSLGMLALAAVRLGLIPAPDWRRARGVVDSQNRTGVFCGTDGVVQAVPVRPGDPGTAGQPLVTLSSPELDGARRAVTARLAQARLQRAESFARDDAGGAAVAQRQMDAFDQQLADLDRRQQRLVVTAPHDGVVVGPDPSLLMGALVRQGQPATLLVDPTKPRIAAVVSQPDAAWLFQLPPDQLIVQMRLVSDPATIITGHGLRPIPGGQRTLPHPALGFAGGGEIEPEAQDTSGMQAKTDQFNVFIDLPPELLASGSLPVGQRVYLRFTLPSKSILEQVIDRVHKTLQGRVNL